MQQAPKQSARLSNMAAYMVLKRSVPAFRAFNNFLASAKSGFLVGAWENNLESPRCSRQEPQLKQTRIKSNILATIEKYRLCDAWCKMPVE
jgi:hypothetical protein